MTERIKKFINGNSSYLWQVLLCALLSISIWQWNRLVGKVDALEIQAVKKPEISELKTDIACIEKILHEELPKISRHMGAVEQYMKDH